MASSEQFSIFGPGITQIWPSRTTDIAKVVMTMRERNHPWERKTNEFHRMISEGVDKKILDHFKRSQFCYATFSGSFTKRDSKCLVKHSGLICLDFDHVQNLEDRFKAICSDQRLDARLVFHSPSGDGIKVIAPMPPDASMQERCFNAYARYFHENFSLEVDPSGKDIARACFLPFDANLFVKPNIK